MRLDIDPELDLLGELEPALEDADRFLELARPEVRLDVEMMDAILGAPFERGLEAVDIGRKTNSLNYETERLRLLHEPLRVLLVRPEPADAVKARFRDHFKVLSERTFGFAPPEAGHAPKGLQHK